MKTKPNYFILTDSVEEQAVNTIWVRMIVDRHELALVPVYSRSQTAHQMYEVLTEEEGILQGGRESGPRHTRSARCGGRPSQGLKEQRTGDFFC